MEEGVHAPNPPSAQNGGGGGAKVAANHPRPEILDVVGLVLHTYAVDAASLLALSRDFSTEDLLRAAVALERPGAPSRLIAAVRTGGSAARVARLLAAMRPIVLNEAVSRGKPALHLCVEALRPDLVGVLLASPALEAWRGEDEEQQAQAKMSYHSAFSLAGTIAADTGRSEAHRHVAAECARAIAVSPVHRIPDSLFTGEGVPVGQTALWVAAAARLPDIVQQILADVRCAFVAVDSRDASGRTAFSAVAWQARDSDRQLSVEERVSAASCARLVGLSGLCDPSAMDGSGQTQLLWACVACLSDVVALWLTDPRVTGAVVNRRVETGPTPFTIAASWARDSDRQLSVEERVSAASCARLVGLSGLCDPSSVGGSGQTQLWWAAQSGLSDVVALWLTDPRVTGAVVNSRVEDGHTAFTIAASWACDSGRKLSVEERVSAVSCARLVGLSGLCDPTAVDGSGRTNLWWAEQAGLSDVVALWQHGPV